jgi:hypothetical protein
MYQGSDFIPFQYRLGVTRQFPKGGRKGHGCAAFVDPSAQSYIFKQYLHRASLLLSLHVVSCSSVRHNMDSLVALSTISSIISLATFTVRTFQERFKVYEQVALEFQEVSSALVALEERCRRVGLLECALHR